jgi:thioredoxin-related protein
MKSKIIAVLALATMLVSAGFIFIPSEQEKTTTTNEVVKWLTYDEAVALSKKNPKPIFIDVYTDWCGWCKEMDKKTFSQPKIAAYLNKKFYSVKLNAEKADSAHYKGKGLTNAELAGKIFHVNSYPTTVYLEADETLLQPLPGYQAPNDFNRIIHYIGDNHYKTTSWDDFTKSFTETIE